MCALGLMPSWGSFLPGGSCWHGSPGPPVFWPHCCWSRMLGKVPEGCHAAKHLKPERPQGCFSSAETRAAHSLVKQLPVRESGQCPHSPWTQDGNRTSLCGRAWHAVSPSLLASLYFSGTLLPGQVVCLFIIVTSPKTHVLVSAKY